MRKYILAIEELSWRQRILEGGLLVALLATASLLMR